MCSEAFGGIIREPIVIETSEDRSALVADLKVRGLWQSQIDGLLDNQVVDTITESIT